MAQTKDRETTRACAPWFGPANSRTSSAALNNTANETKRTSCRKSETCRPQTQSRTVGTCQPSINFMKMLGGAGGGGGRKPEWPQLGGDACLEDVEGSLGRCSSPRDIEAVELQASAVNARATYPPCHGCIKARSTGCKGIKGLQRTR